MIVVDSSAVIAIAFEEPERDVLLDALAEHDTALMSIATLVEARMVAAGRGDRFARTFERVLHFPQIQFVPVDLEHAEIAHSAFARFGKGMGHPAQLNFGDLFSYALAKQRAVPLLFKGTDFAHTDIASALYQ